jgi:hypothetical protein
VELLRSEVNTFIGTVHRKFCMATFQCIYAQLGGAGQYVITRELACS